MRLLLDQFRTSQRRACRLAGRSRNTQGRPVPVADIEEEKLWWRILELARRHVLWGRRLVYRHLRLGAGASTTSGCNGSGVRRGCRGPCRAAANAQGHPAAGRDLLRAEYPRHVWAIDLQSGRTMDGRSLKFLIVMDEFSHVCLAIRAGRRCRALDVIDTMKDLLTSSTAYIEPGSP